jgi:hypothetical protein
MFLTYEQAEPHVGAKNQRLGDGEMMLAELFAVLDYRGSAIQAITGAFPAPWAAPASPVGCATNMKTHR